MCSGRALASSAAAGDPYTVAMRTFAAFLVMLLGAGIVPAAAQSAFADVIRGDEKEAVADLTALGRVEGYADGSFRPRATVNRAELLKMLLTEQAQAAPETPCFSDVPAEAWFAPSVCSGRRAGIVVGYPDGTFRPEAEVTVAEGLSMMVRAMHIRVDPTESEPWTERFETAAQQEGLIDRAAYHPHQRLTRGLAAVLLSRALAVRDGAMQDAMREHLSAGCGSPMPVTPPASVRVNGERRPFLLTVPEGYTPRTPHKLLVAFHGRTNSNEQVRDYMGLDRNGEGFIIAYPQGMSRGDGSYSWSDTGDSTKSLRDFALFDALVEDIALQYCIDRDEIFVAGHSLGAWFASTLACARGDVIRGSAVLAGGISALPCTGPAAAILFHHREDKLVPFAEGERNRDKKIEQNMCSNEGKTVRVGAFSCTEYRDCRTGNPVTFCPSGDGEGFDSVGNNTHTWPRPTGQAVMEFFRSL